jgi:acetolactate decarboxylase
LLNGVYDGTTTAGEARRHGDLGLGAFAKLDGEMVAVDGHIYRVTADGHVSEASDDAEIAFAAMTRFSADKAVKLPLGLTFDNLQKFLDPILANINQPYAVRIEGRFAALTTRAVPEQEKPYPLLCEVLKTQPIFELGRVDAVLVGFRGPPFLGNLNTAGYHLHALTRDAQRGGHVLEFTVEEATLSFLPIDRSEIVFPTTSALAEANLSTIETCTSNAS